MNFPNLCKRQNNQDEFTTAFNQIAIAMKEGINLFEDNDSFPAFDDDSSINENQANINESKIEYGDKNFNIKDLLHDD
ncbi:unnamed protein product [Rhizophagus irregularis]|nr:unnamed protein product [Rhizophagus irregularis]